MVKKNCQGCQKEYEGESWTTHCKVCWAAMKSKESAQTGKLNDPVFGMIYKVAANQVMQKGGDFDEVFKYFHEKYKKLRGEY